MITESIRESFQNSFLQGLEQVFQRAHTAVMHMYYECSALRLRIRNDTAIYSIKYLDEYNKAESYSYFFIKMNETEEHIEI